MKEPENNFEIIESPLLEIIRLVALNGDKLTPSFQDAVAQFLLLETTPIIINKVVPRAK